MIRLFFEDNGSDHDDLVLEFPGGKLRCDSYYMAIAFDAIDENINHSRLRKALRSLLVQFSGVVEEAGDIDTLHLPFDLSDQYTGWIRCTFDRSHVQIDIGWSRLEGYAIDLKNIRRVVRDVSDFRAYADSAQFETNRSELVEAIQANITSLT